MIQYRFQSTIDAINLAEAPTPSSIPVPASILENVPEAPIVQTPAAALLENIPEAPVVPPVESVSGFSEPAFATLLENIPEAPVVPTVESIVELAEPAFATLGLGGWSPVGMVQNCMEYLHIGLDIPWWGSVLIGTVVVRSVIFPLVILAQRNAAKMNNHLPQLQLLQLKMTEARQSGNAIESARYGQEMVQFMRDKQLNPLKNMLVPLAQAPIFISFFVGLRGMANAPVESMRYGGLFWFTDLTVPDQFYALPIITSMTMWLTIEVGTDSARLSSQNLQTMRYVLRALPVLILPFTVNFPGAILLYWTLSNFISLAQVGFLRLPKVRHFFKIEKLVNHNTDALPIKKKGFKEGLQECEYKNKNNLFRN